MQSVGDVNSPVSLYFDALIALRGPGNYTFTCYIVTFCETSHRDFLYSEVQTLLLSKLCHVSVLRS